MGLWGHNLVKIEAKIEVFGVKIGASLATIGSPRAIIGALLAMIRVLE